MSQRVSVIPTIAIASITLLIMVMARWDALQADETSRLPDLVVDQLTVGNSSPMTDQAFMLNATVRNQGTGTSGITILNYYRSTDSTVTSSDTEVGTDRVSALDPSGSSTESVLTFAPSTPGTYYYGTCVNSVSDESDTASNCSAAVAATVSEFRMENLPWVADAITGNERRAMNHIRALAQIDSSMSQRVAGSPWLSDGVTENELQTMADLLNLARTRPEMAILITTVPDQTSRLIEAVLVSSRAILYSGSGRLKQLLSQSWFQDGLTEDEAALIVTLRSTLDSEEVFQDLLQGGHVQSETVSLPLAGEVNLFAVGRSEPELEGVLEHMGIAVESMEGFMGTPWPNPNVIALLELESDLGYTLRGGFKPVGMYVGTHIELMEMGRRLIYHESGHYYFNIFPEWLDEGGANLLMLYTLHLAGNVKAKFTSAYFDVKSVIAQVGDDSYYGPNNGYHFLLGMYLILGHEVVSTTLRELYERTLTSEHEIYQAFLTNTPLSQRDKFRDAYLCLRGRYIPGYTATPKAAPSPEIREALVALYRATNGPGWTNSKNWMSTAPIHQWRGVVSDCDGSVSGLTLNSNQLAGQIPSELGSLSELKTLWLRDNQLTGPIPPELGNLSNLDSLILDWNQLSGPIPTELGNLSNLAKLQVQGSELSGPIPTELGNLSNLESLLLNINQLSGPIPPELGNLSNLTTLMLNSNQLSGPIPSSLGNLSNLTGLYLGRNQLSGCIPATLQDVESSDLNRLGLPFCAETLLDRYDENDDGVIDSAEVLRAVADYFSGVISASEVLEVVSLYFAAN